MILRAPVAAGDVTGKPRASGDDPDIVEDLPFEVR